MDNLPVTDVIEQSIANNVNALVGNRDVNLNTIVKIAMMNEIKPLDATKVDNVLNSIYQNNQLEQFFINKEYQLTMDNSGNLIYIDEEENQDNTGSKLPESK